MQTVKYKDVPPPSWALKRRFLLVTMLLIFSSAFSVATAFHLYITLPLEWEMGILFSGGLVFCFVNVKVTRGSFLSAKILQYFSLLLALMTFPAFFFVLPTEQYIGSAINVGGMLCTYYLISSQAYQKLIQHQFAIFERIKETQEIIQKDIARRRQFKK